MHDSTVSSRDELARLWLPWYVSRDGQRVIEDLGLEADDARGLCVADTVDRDHPVLQHPHPDPSYPGWTHNERIEHYVAEMRELETIVIEAPAWEIDAGVLLLDRCHRACAIYRLDPPDWLVKLTLSPARADALDALPGLRSA